jgi:hypothetical protein
VKMTKLVVEASTTLGGIHLIRAGVLAESIRACATVNKENDLERIAKGAAAGLVASLVASWTANRAQNSRTRRSINSPGLPVKASARASVVQTGPGFWMQEDRFSAFQQSVRVQLVCSFAFGFAWSTLTVNFSGMRVNCSSTRIVFPYIGSFSLDCVFTRERHTNPCLLSQNPREASETRQLGHIDQIPILGAWYDWVLCRGASCLQKLQNGKNCIRVPYWKGTITKCHNALWRLVRRFQEGCTTLNTIVTITRRDTRLRTH